MARIQFWVLEGFLLAYFALLVGRPHPLVNNLAPTLFTSVKSA
jgi:hypothetical protein